MMALVTHIKKLFDNVAGDGGYILTNKAVLDDHITENIHAMIDTSREYGKY